MQTIIFFDGVCPLCNRFITFAFNNDKKRYFKFASLQSKTAAQLLSPQDQGLDSIVYLEGKTTYKRSAAVLRIMFHLNGAFAVLSMIFSVFPARFRDFIYDKIAVNRYRIFGKSEVCRVPTPEEKEFFLD